MTGRELYLKVKDIYRENDGESFFSLSLLWAAIREKRGLDAGTALSDGPVADARVILGDAARLCAGEPLQYYLGHWEFFGRDFVCREGVLIPREDTELLVRLCIEKLPENGRLADLCCGSGCVGISVLAERPDCTCVSVDVSDDAVALTKENAARLGVSDRMTVEKLDVLTEKLPECELLACNPPYIPTRDLAGLPGNVLREPALALDGGEDGLRFYRRLKAAADKPLVCEMGFDQRECIAALFGENAQFFTDTGGRDRCFFVP